MKVLVFISSIDKKDGGPSRSVPILAKGIFENGADVTLMTVESNNMNTHAVEDTGVTLRILHKNISFSELESIIINDGFDIIHNQMIWLPIYHMVAKIARKHKIPYLTTPRGTLEPWALTGQGIAKTIKKKFAMLMYQRTDINKADCILTTANMEENNLRTLGFKGPVAIIPNGIETDNYPCRPIDSQPKKRAVFLSRIHPKKGIEVLIEAWERVIVLFPDWELIIVGNGEPEYINYLNGMICSKSLSSSVTILPPAFGEQKYKYYAESAFFVLPTYSENFGMVIAEALSCGIPVLTTKNAPWEILEETNTGWWIDLSKENLEDALIEIMQCPLPELIKMGQKGAKVVQENFNYREVGRKLLSVYNWLLGQEDKPDWVH